MANAEADTGFSRRARRRRLAFDLCFGLLAAVAIVSLALVQLLDEMRIPHCLTAAPVSLAALLAPCAAPPQ